MTIQRSRRQLAQRLLKIGRLIGEVTWIARKWPLKAVSQQRGYTDALPAKPARRFRLGCIDRELSDRRRRARGWARREHLGHLLPASWPHRQWRQWRRGLRSLPSLCRGHRADARARHRRLPVFRGLAEDPAGWSRRGE